jgi:hypothetical protein
MDNIGISIGWNCQSATIGVKLGIRKKKNQGYNTCPFDQCITNYNGIIRCIEEDFLYFTDSNYLEIIEAPYSTGGIKKGEKLLYNTRYKFIFNHESPGHGNLYSIQKWKGGLNHFIDNDYYHFKERYNKRIQNFRNYMDNRNNITFILTIFQTDENACIRFNNLISKVYPSLNFNVKLLHPNDTKICVYEHMKLCKLDKDEIDFILK